MARKAVQKHAPWICRFLYRLCGGQHKTDLETKVWLFFAVLQNRAMFAIALSRRLTRRFSQGFNFVPTRYFGKGLCLFFCFSRVHKWDHNKRSPTKRNKPANCSVRQSHQGEAEDFTVLLFSKAQVISMCSPKVSPFEWQLQINCSESPHENNVPDDVPSGGSATFGTGKHCIRKQSQSSGQLKFLHKPWRMEIVLLSLPQNSMKAQRECCKRHQLVCFVQCITALVC